MASKSFFSQKGTTVPTATATNYSGKPAYKLSSKYALAQLAVTGCFNQTFYTSGEDQLQQVLALARECEPEFVAKVAIYAQESGFMKDMPAALMVYLTTVDLAVARKAFPRVIRNGKMLRNFAQILRSGAFGRHNLSAKGIQKLIQGWFDARTEDELFRMSVGNNPSFGDVIKMARVTPKSKERSALYAYFIGKTAARFGTEVFPIADVLPERVKAYEEFLKNPHPTEEIPDVPLEMALGLQLSIEGWRTVARRASWFQTFRTMNTFARHGVLSDPEMVEFLSNRLRNPDLIRKAQVFPYQILMAYKAIVEGQTSFGKKGANDGDNYGDLVKIAGALQDALEFSCENIPTLEGQVVICPDVSGSMSSPVTGNRINPKTGKVERHTTKVSCVEVAGLMSAAILRKNSQARVIPFDTEAYSSFPLNPRDSILTNAQKLGALRGGGTDCSCPLKYLNKARAKADVVIFISDYESWGGAYGASRGTPMMEEWGKFHSRNPGAKLICIDLTPHGTTQTPNTPNILHVGGFSDKVFEVVTSFANGKPDKAHWTKVIEDVEL